VVLAVGAEQAWRHGHDYIVPERFAVVEPGAVYRGAWLKDWPMREVARKYGIKTIVALAHQPDHPLSVQERALARELGIRWIHIPIVDDRSSVDSDVLCEKLEMAAKAIADPANQPVYFHCHHGINRASMVQMAYRMVGCGWTLDEATAEVAKLYGLRTVDRGPDYRFMAQFYRERILPARGQGSGDRTARVETTEVR
jgi:protein tyrosine/serine phosphatase